MSILIGKTYKDAALPLEDHLADVAAVFSALLHLPVIRKRISRLAGNFFSESAIARLACLAALHDLGKITSGFQNKVHGTGNSHGHIVPIPGLFAQRNVARLLECMPFLLKWDGCEGGIVLEYLCATFSHHGSPIRVRADERLAGLWPKDRQAPAWVFVAELAAKLRCWFPAAFVADAQRLPTAPEAQHYFAGLVMLADWLGSDNRFFPVDRETQDSPQKQRHDPMEFSREAAASALQVVGLDCSRFRQLAPSLPPFELQFPFSPNPLQDTVEQLPLPEQGSLTIIEAETGFGKTEAALRYFAKLWFAGLVDGLYLANPLRFAATQLFGRTVRFVQRTFGDNGPPVVLAVPGYLRVDDASGVRLPEYQVHWNDSPPPEKTTRRWACEHPKRYLAGTISVGTIDQALLASLRTPHAHMRATALSRSLLVIDEVHASDSYMTALSCHVVKNFRRWGGHVLLLSATLEGSTRQRYLQAMGASVSSPDLETCLAVPYPAVSTVERIFPVEDDRLLERRKPPVRVRLSPIIDLPDAVARLARDAITTGGRVLVLRNSIRAAVDTLVALEGLLGKTDSRLFRVAGVVAPHHSRFAPVDRENLDAEVERLFGKTGVSKTGVLVSTQTLEQSLDVDFDVLITDLCPMDVLLQRIGREHRHRARDPHRAMAWAAPVCFVLVPNNFSGDSLRQARRHQFGRERAYINLPALMAAWELLRRLEQENAPLDIPGQSRTYIETTLHPDALEDVARRHDMQQELDAVFGLSAAHGQNALLRTMDWRTPFSETPELLDDWAHQATRLGLDDLVVSFNEPAPGPFGNMIDQLCLPGWMAGDFSEEAAPEIVEFFTNRASLPPLEQGGAGFRFRLGDKYFSYNRYGLKQERDT